MFLIKTVLLNLKSLSSKTILLYFSFDEDMLLNSLNSGLSLNATSVSFCQIPVLLSNEQLEIKKKLLGY